MRLGTRFGRAAALVAAGMATATTTGVARAADHRDGGLVQVIEDGGADITDVFAWMNGDRAVLAMNVHRDAGPGALFSDAVQYVFHVRRHVKYDLAGTSSVDVICQFDEAQMIQCWVGDEAYVTGDASAEQGITNATEDIRVFAGPRQDPFFHYAAGFDQLVANTRSSLPFIISSGSFEESGCPDIEFAGPAPFEVVVGDDNHFADENVLAIVIELDASYLVEPAAPVFSVWGATHLKPD